MNRIHATNFEKKAGTKQGKWKKANSKLALAIGASLLHASYRGQQQRTLGDHVQRHHSSLWKLLPPYKPRGKNEGSERHHWNMELAMSRTESRRRIPSVPARREKSQSSKMELRQEEEEERW